MLKIMDYLEEIERQPLNDPARGEGESADGCHRVLFSVYDLCAGARIEGGR